MEIRRDLLNWAAVLWVGAVGLLGGAITDNFQRHEANDKQIVYFLPNVDEPVLSVSKAEVHERERNAGLVASAICAGGAALCGCVSLFASDRTVGGQQTICDSDLSAFGQA